MSEKPTARELARQACLTVAQNAEPLWPSQEGLVRHDGFVAGAMACAEAVAAADTMLDEVKIATKILRKRDIPTSEELYDMIAQALGEPALTEKTYLGDMADTMPNRIYAGAQMIRRVLLERVTA
jgi:hypothetical protein